MAGELAPETLFPFSCQANPGVSVSFYVLKAPNLSPWACMASVVPTEPALQTLFFFEFVVV